MRERLAKLFAAGLVLSVTGLAALFAERQNARGPVGADGVPGSGASRGVPPPSLPPDTSAVARGREAFVALGCLRCHRVAGAGSPRSVLDGVGDRRLPDDIRGWIVADSTVLPELPGSAARAKSEYQTLSGEDLDDLVAYLTSLRGGG